MNTAIRLKTFQSLISNVVAKFCHRLVILQSAHGVPEEYSIRLCIPRMGWSCKEEFIETGRNSSNNFLKNENS